PRALSLRCCGQARRPHPSPTRRSSDLKACENITARRVKVIAPDNQLLVSPRDGWKLFANRGNVLMDETYMEGVRWDGQNVHGSLDRKSTRLTSSHATSAYAGFCWKQKG